MGRARRVKLLLRPTQKFKKGANSLIKQLSFKEK